MSSGTLLLISKTFSLSHVVHNLIMLCLGVVFVLFCFHHFCAWVYWASRICEFIVFIQIGKCWPLCLYIVFFPHLQKLQLHLYKVAQGCSTASSHSVHFLFFSVFFSLCLILDSLISTSSGSLIFYSAMSNLLLILSSAFLISDIVIYIHGSLMWVSYILSYMSLTCSIFPLAFWTNGMQL